MKKICLITGGTRGIGFETAKGLAERGMHVVLVARDEQAGITAQQSIVDLIPGAVVDFMVADLSSQQSIRAMAAAFSNRYSRLDVLLNNAGVFVTDLQYTIDGVELQFAVNHLSYFLLTQQLLNVILRTPASRIVNVSSRGHRYGNISFNDLYHSRSYIGVKAYAQSKLANILFTYHLASLLKDYSTTVNCLHPGSIRTEIGTRYSSGISHLIWKWHPFLKSVAQGATTPIYLASHPDVEHISGKYFYQCKTVDSSHRSHDRSVGAQLWKISEQITGATYSLAPLPGPDDRYSFRRENPASHAAFSKA